MNQTKWISISFLVSLSPSPANTICISLISIKQGNYHIIIKVENFKADIEISALKFSRCSSFPLTVMIILLLIFCLIIQWTSSNKVTDTAFPHQNYACFCFLHIQFYVFSSCKKEGQVVYYGDHCNMTVGGDSSTTTTPTPLTDPLPSKQMILAISGGVGGALLLIIIISSVCFCRRLQHEKKRKG